MAVQVNDIVDVLCVGLLLFYDSCGGSLIQNDECFMDIPISLVYSCNNCSLML